MLIACSPVSLSKFLRIRQSHSQIYNGCVKECGRAEFAPHLEFVANTGELSFDHRDGVRPKLEACGRVVDLLAVPSRDSLPHQAYGSSIVRNLRPDRVQRVAIKEFGAETPRLDDGDLDTKWSRYMIGKRTLF
jgi:hypothetical protein